MRMLLAEDLLLLLLDNETGKKSGENREIALGGALLTELALDGAVEVVESRRLFSGARVRAVPGADPDDEVLARALATVGEKERTAQDLVTRLGKRLEPTLLDRLAAAGILDRREHDVLGIFPTTRWPSVDDTEERDVRRRLGDALVRGATPGDRDAALLGLLSALGSASKVLDREGRSRRERKELDARAKEIADGDWAAEGVRRAVRAAQDATVAAASAAATSAAVVT